jgi:hypothetical protein
MKLLESDSPKCLCLNVCKLVLSDDEVNTNLPIFPALPGEVVAHMDVFATFMKDRIILYRDKADILSIFSSTVSTSFPLKSPSSRANHTACVAAVLAAIYSASQDESATTFCLRACQLTKLLP